MVIDTNNLSVAQKIMLAEDLWDSVLSNVSESDISDNEKFTLDQALEDLDKNPMGGVSWLEMKAKIKNKIHGWNNCQATGRVWYS